MRPSKVLAIGLILLAPASSLPAQRLVSVVLGGGVSLPQGDLHSGVDLGWHALGALAIGTPMQPLGLRVDVAYSRFPFNMRTKTLIDADGNEAVGSATLNASYRLPTPGSPMSPYLIAGLGAYRIDCSFGCDATTKFGWNAGLGTKMYFLGFRSFLEARFHSTEVDESHVNYFPITFGFVF